MIARFAILALTLLAFSPASAGTLDADAARHFVLGKLFAFTCFDGSRGAGRVYDDGSVLGVIQLQGLGPVRSASLPPGTLRVKGNNVCAAHNSMSIEPCFDLNRTGDQSFRGSLLGLDAAYCDFTQRQSITPR
jgi:hypothetical protein